MISSMSGVALHGQLTGRDPAVLQLTSYKTNPALDSSRQDQVLVTDRIPVVPKQDDPVVVDQMIVLVQVTGRAGQGLVIGPQLAISQEDRVQGIDR